MFLNFSSPSEVNFRIIFDGYCRWKLSSGNLYTFIRPNRNSCEKCNFRSLAGIEPVALRFRCSALTNCRRFDSCQGPKVVFLAAVPG